MANPEHLAILKQGVAVWNEWREVNQGTQPELNYADLVGQFLPKVNLKDEPIGVIDLLAVILLRIGAILWAAYFLFFSALIFYAQGGPSTTLDISIAVGVMLFLMAGGIWFWRISNEIRKDQPFRQIATWWRKRKLARAGGHDSSAYQLPSS
ncbi:MAG: hypothetical protein NTY98_04555 [Verrucomicrobia bacterium]|nr:hypothetical protein [Verrucomicrobiota bacterium]